MNFLQTLSTNKRMAAPSGERYGRRLSIFCCAALTVAAVAVPTSGPAVASSVRVFANCTAMHGVYPHGVGRPGAVDKTRGKRDTKYFRSSALYGANRHSDRDNDGIACEA